MRTVEFIQYGKFYRCDDTAGKTYVNIYIYIYMYIYKYIHSWAHPYVFA